MTRPGSPVTFRQFTFHQYSHCRNVSESHSDTRLASALPLVLRARTLPVVACPPSMSSGGKCPCHPRHYLRAEADEAGAP